MTLASYITFLRIVLIFPIIYLTYLGNSLAISLAVCIFLIAGITDYLDGYIARKTNTVSSLGVLLDLLADKLLVCLLLIWFIYFYPKLFFIIPVMVIVARELVMSSARQLSFQDSSKRSNLKVSNLGKSKTTLQFISVAILILSLIQQRPFFILGLSLLWISALTALYSMFDYLKRWRGP